MSSQQPKIAALGKLTLGAEANYAEEASGGNTKYVKAVSVDVSGLTKEGIEDVHQRQRDYKTAHIAGPAKGTITTTHYLSGWSGAGAAIAAPPVLSAPLKDGVGGTIDGFQLLMSALGSALGHVHSGGFANDVNTGTSTTDAVNCTAGSGGTAFTIGQAVSFIDSDGMAHVNYAKNVTAGTVTLLQTAKATVRDEAGGGTTDGRLYGSHTIFQTTGDTYHGLTTACKSYTLTAYGHDSDDKVVAVGCMPTGVTMSLAVGELPTMTITWGVSSWSEAGSGGLGDGASVEVFETAGGDLYPLCEPFVTGWVTKGATQANPTRINSVEVDFQISRPEILDPSFTSGVGGFGPVTRAPQVSFTVFRDYSEEATDFINQTGKIYSITMGSQPGKMINILVPNARVIDYPARGEENGAVTSNVTIAANYYDGDTGSTPADQSTPIDSDFRIAFA
tara:strand:- start:5893 stop:7236 length:1344 start_codon:yes stop_codon:yes gene_type:complete